MTGNRPKPAHIGIIMDGNGRWAKQRGLPRIEGHRRGADRALDIIRAAAGAGIEVLTLYTFSLENWQRPKKEISLLMSLLERYLEKELAELERGNIRFRVIGETWRLPKGVLAKLENAVRKTESNTGMILVSALSYGGRNELVRAARKAIESGLRPEQVDDDALEGFLDTAGLPPVDLVIRTSGELRLSNFLLWQSAYAELYFTETLWPDFSREEFEKAIEDYQGRERRFGAVPEGAKT